MTIWISQKDQKPQWKNPSVVKQNNSVSQVVLQRIYGYCIKKGLCTKKGRGGEEREFCDQVTFESSIYFSPF